MTILRRPKLLVVAFCIVVAIGVLGTLTGQTAQARLECRSDPFVELSDGTVLDISADIGTMLWRIKRVQYTLYVPAGLKVVAWQSTPNWPTTTEKFTVYATNPPGLFTTAVMVTTAESSVPVTAHFSLNTIFMSKQGKSGQTLTLKIRR